MAETRRSERNRRSSSVVSVEQGSSHSGNKSRHSNYNNTVSNNVSQRTNGRRKHRRAGKGGEKHRRKWKPYDKLSLEEKLILGEKEAITAEKKRENALREGHPVAPFNTTQFIMEEHSGGKGITPRMIANRSLSTSMNCPSSGHCASGFCSQQDTPIRDDMADDADVYFEREYNAALESVRMERLQSMNAQQLRAEVLRLEAEIDSINKNTMGEIEEKNNQILKLKNTLARQRELFSKFAELAKVELSGSPETSHKDQTDSIH